MSHAAFPKRGHKSDYLRQRDNLPNVIQYLKKQYPKRLEKILSILSDWVPCLEKVDTELMIDGRLLLQIKDAPFEEPISAEFASDAMLKILSFLTLLYAPDPPQLIGIEKPENHLHPRLLNGLVEEYREASALSQLMITTHSPYFVNGLHAEEVWVLYRNEQGLYSLQTHIGDAGNQAFSGSGCEVRRPLDGRFF